MAADGGNIESQNALGNIYKDTNIDEAIKWFRMAAMQNSKEAQDILKLFKPKKRSTVKLQELIDFSNKGDVKAMVQLGLKYENGEAGEAGEADEAGEAGEAGEAVKKNISAAFDLYKKAAERENVKAMVQLGLIYENGTNGEYNIDRAVEFYDTAFKKANSAIAANHLGRLYEVGIFFEQNLDEAKKMYTAASLQGGKDQDIAKKSLKHITDTYNEHFSKYELQKYTFDRIIEYNLMQHVNKQPLLDKCIQCVIIKLYDEDVTKDLIQIQIQKLIKRVVDEENALGYVAQGVMYMKGIWGVINVELAFNSFRSAVEKGNAIGQIALGIMYMNGIWVKTDAAETFKLFTLAKNQGNVIGYAGLGMMHMNGIATSKNIGESQKLFEYVKSKKIQIDKFMLPSLSDDLIKDAITSIE